MNVMVRYGVAFAAGLLDAATTYWLITPSPPMRLYYLTNSPRFNGSQALGACASGYHMASLWEVHEPSNLRYATKLGATRADAGLGPAEGVAGWVRFGGVAQSTATGGTCDAWTTGAEANWGTAAYLVPQNGGGWVLEPYRCSTTFPVWCVQD